MRISDDPLTAVMKIVDENTAEEVAGTTAPDGVLVALAAIAYEL